jgi:Glyoxalase/Bleomycin resistance protein/Dioxygenase superfamily
MNNAGAAIFGSPVQVAYVVEDAVKAARTWAVQLGAGPFFVRPHIALIQATLREEPCPFDHTSAYGQWGSVMVELVQDHTVGPSITDGWRGSAPRLHHVACIVDDYAEALRQAAAKGFEVAFEASTRTTQFAFIDTRKVNGHYVEVYPRTNTLDAFYQRVRNAADGWDGTDSVTML